MGEGRASAPHARRKVPSSPSLQRELEETRVCPSFQRIFGGCVDLIENAPVPASALSGAWNRCHLYTAMATPFPFCLETLDSIYINDLFIHHCKLLNISCDASGQRTTSSEQGGRRRSAALGVNVVAVEGGAPVATRKAKSSGREAGGFRPEVVAVWSCRTQGLFDSGSRGPRRRLGRLLAAEPTQSNGSALEEMIAP